MEFVPGVLPSANKTKLPLPANFKLASSVCCLRVWSEKSLFISLVRTGSATELSYAQKQFWLSYAQNQFLKNNNQNCV